MPSPHPRTKAPKARAGYTNPSDFAGEYHFEVSKSADPSDDRQWTQPVAVIPTATAKAAKLLVKVANMDPIQRNKMLDEAIRKELLNRPNQLQCFMIGYARRAVLSALGFTPDKAEGKAP